MSDFDAEAERKRLREKYEAEEEKRKQTQQMSELLLKGATMTNRHCGECGSPIFRYEDQEFCPNCRRAAGETAENEAASGAAAGETAETADADGTPTGAGATADTDADPAGTEHPRRSTGVTAGSGPGVASEPSDAGDAAVSNGAGVVDDGPGSTAEDSPDRARTAADEPAEPQPDVGSDPAAERDDDPAPTRQAARESLLSALTRHARLAADTDEPRRATDHLAAAREAAAALDELDGS